MPFSSSTDDRKTRTAPSARLTTLPGFMPFSGASLAAACCSASSCAAPLQSEPSVTPSSVSAMTDTAQVCSPTLASVVPPAPSIDGSPLIDRRAEPLCASSLETNTRSAPSAKIAVWPTPMASLSSAVSLALIASEEASSPDPEPPPPPAEATAEAAMRALSSIPLEMSASAVFIASVWLFAVSEIFVLSAVCISSSFADMPSVEARTPSVSASGSTLLSFTACSSVPSRSSSRARASCVLVAASAEASCAGVSDWPIASAILLSLTAPPTATPASRPMMTPPAPKTTCLLDMLKFLP